MYTSEQINQIMQELGLSPTDASARKVIEQLANSKPNAPDIDAQFISELREDLQRRSSSKNITENSQSINLLSFFMNKTLVSALVVTLVVIGAGGVWYAKNSDQPLFQSSGLDGGSQLLSGKYDVKTVAQESFGDLDKIAVVTEKQALATNNAGGYGAGGNSVSTSTMPTEDQKLIAPGEPYPGQVYYTFSYQGAKTLPGLQESQPVLKRIKPQQPASLVSRVVNLLSFGLIDLSMLKNVQMQNLSFIEDREYGYGVFVDVQQGMVNMYQNYERWPQVDYSSAPLKIEELPSDEQVISSADAFLKEYSISKDGYGTPRVVQQWRLAYEAASASDRVNYYIPEQVQVIYPLILDGKEVYDESGNVYGLNVIVDARTKRVTNLYELNSKQYERSEYKGEIDSTRIFDIVKNGGFRNYNYPDQVGKRVDLKIGTPTVQMVKIYYSVDNYRTSSDLYVPALVFPIENWKEANYWRQTVMVPLVKSLLDTEIQNPPVMPLDVPVSNVKGPLDPVLTPTSEIQGE